MSTDQVVTGPQRDRGASLESVPGDFGLPILGHTFDELRDPLGHMRHMHKTYGRIFRTNSFFFKKVVVIGPEAAEQILFNRDGAFSCRGGWERFMRGLMEDNLLLMDGEHHREQRRLLQVAVHPEALRGYFGVLRDGYSSAITHWGAQRKLKFFMALKKVTLEQATKVFYGLEGGDQERLNAATTDMTQAMLSLIRLPIPGTKYWRGLQGAKLLEKIIAEEIPRRRASCDIDILSRLCAAREGDRFILSDRQIIDHFKPFWMAAHDTITSSTTSMTYELARHPDWQERVRQELVAVCGDEPLRFDDLANLPITEAVYNESMRLHAPVPSLPRKALRDFQVEGVVIPKGAVVIPLLFYNHTMEEYWPEPDRFDPNRFLDAGSTANRPKLAFSPFGGGAHTCLGIRFAYMTMKIIMADMLRRFVIKLQRPTAEEFYPLPICRPKSGLPIELERLS